MNVFSFLKIIIIPPQGSHMPSSGGRVGGGGGGVNLHFWRGNAEDSPHIIVQHVTFLM